MRLTLNFESFKAACEFLKGLLMSTSSDDDESINFLEEGFKIEGINRQIAAHFVFHHHHQNNNIENNNNNNFAPKPAVEPELDADILALGSEDV